MNWVEENLESLHLLEATATTLPQHADNNFYELDSDFRPQELLSLGSSRSGNFFSNRTQASAYGSALATMMTLRHLPGNVKWRDDAFIISVEWNGDCCDVYAVQIETPVFAVSGYFETLEQAESAIEVVGRLRIAQAHKTLMCVN